MAITLTTARIISLHLVGIGVTHSIAPPMHNFIAKSLGLPWTFHSTECATIEEAIALGRNPSTAGLVVTMPYKQTIMQRLDGTDPLASTIGACNNVYRDKEHPERLRGTNTDWLGIKGCLLEQGEKAARADAPALVVGAGGASRAAVYALSAHLACTAIYVLNRDEAEVEELVRDCRRLSPVPAVVHVASVGQAKALDTPCYIVGTVPDFEHFQPSLWVGRRPKRHHFTATWSDISTHSCQCHMGS